jgi:hypothetical protein
MARLRIAILFLLAVTTATGCSAHRESESNPNAPEIETARPEPATATTARLVASIGLGAHRLALWRARNADGDLCVGSRLGPGRAPQRFSCQRRGLERPVLWVQGGGGKGDNVDWGGDVGLVAPGVTSVVADGKRPRLRPAPGLPNWRFFAEGGSRQPASGLTAYAGERQLLEDDGLWINPDGQGCNCGRNAQGWFGTYAYVPEQQSGDDARALDAALAVPGVVEIIGEHGPAWIDMPTGWQKCTGGTIGLAADIKLWHDASFFATLPFEEPAKEGTHSAYMTGVHRVFASDSDELQIWFDTHSQRVVGVDTAFEHGSELSLDTLREPVPGGGYDDPSQCPTGD